MSGKRTTPDRHGAMTGPRFQRDASAADIVASLDEHGYAIVERLADEETLASLNGDFDAFVGVIADIVIVQFVDEDGLGKSGY